MEVTCLADSAVPRSVFLEDEKKLLKTITGLLGSIIEKKEAEMSLKQKTEELREQAVELEICNLIKNGLPNKEIAVLLQISLLTVERHRHNIRKKLHIDNEKINLATFLRDL